MAVFSQTHQATGLTTGYVNTKLQTVRAFLFLSFRPRSICQLICLCKGFILLWVISLGRPLRFVLSQRVSIWSFLSDKMVIYRLVIWKKKTTNNNNNNRGDNPKGCFPKFTGGCYIMCGIYYFMCERIDYVTARRNVWVTIEIIDVVYFFYQDN